MEKLRIDDQPGTGSNDRYSRSARQSYTLAQIPIRVSGKEQEEGTFFHILSLIVTTMYEPKFLPIDFAFDLDGRTTRVSVPGILETASQPIRNSVTHQPHRIEVKIPEGFEYREAEIASAWIKGTGVIKFDLPDAHSSLALVDHTPSGPV